MARAQTAIPKQRAAVSVQRDYVTEMREVIDAAISTKEYNASLVAREIAEKLRATDPDLLQGWLDLQAEQHLREEIIRIDHSKRTAAQSRSRRSASVFAAAAKNFEEKLPGAKARGKRVEPDADLEAIRHGWLDTRFNVEGQRRLLGDLTGREVNLVADDYKNLARSNSIRELFMRAIAKATGPNRKVGDKFTNEKLDELWRSLGN